MKNDYTNNKFQELLEKLQQESWQLELLISGFAIFGLFQALDPIEYYRLSSVANESYTKLLYVVAGISCKVLIVNLIIHVVLRGLWIGAIGLRYVSSDIDYEALNYKSRFTNHLKKKVGSFDKYIGTLENYCSVLFAVTFLYLFYIISFFMVIGVIFLVGAFFIETGYFSKMLGFMLLGFFAIGYFFLAFLVFIDFITQGYLKKVEWISFLYFPLYKVFSVLTLSFLYRPLVYNFLDNKFGRRLLLILFPIYLSAFYFSTVTNVRSSFILTKSHSSKNYSYQNNYIRKMCKNQFVKKAAIQDKIITKPYLNIFIPFRSKIEKIVLQQYPNLKPIKDLRGFTSSFFKSRFTVSDSLETNYLNKLNAIYKLKIDGNPIQTDFLITEVNSQLGFEHIELLNKLSEGKHLLTIKRSEKDEETKEISEKDIIEIPFWYLKS
ncbi:hypothetical protein [uncultured Polaribacter sp.]|uniref:hypothetical protein n=1 Tax=uncultured Polaribacter sp. TaxID=174711 RepID=UPI002629B7E6|nr:hypothetical protein [uncultured Polaribacter sp.]